MTQQQKNNIKQRQAIKKYLVFAAMAIVFAVCMWLIFAPSGSDKEASRQGAGFNADIPDPKDEGIVGDKKAAYEQEQARLKQEEKMRSLQDYSFMLGAAEEDMGEYQEDAGMEPMPTDYQYNTRTGEAYTGSYGSRRGRGTNSFETSSSAYMDINRTLGNFYDEPEEDLEKEALREEIEQLKSAMEEQQKVTLSYDDQVALLEKSYELAAKYMPAGTGPVVQGSDLGKVEDLAGNDKKTKVLPVSNLREPVVTSLSQPVPDMDFIKQPSRERNLGFNTVSDAGLSIGKNSINAVVHGDQTLVNGQSVNLRTVEAMQAGEYIIPRNTILTGVGKISGERLEIMVSSIEHGGNIIPVHIDAYDSDGQRGIYIPGSIEMTTVKEIAGNMGQNMGSSINITQQSAGQQLLTDLGRGAIQGASQFISKKAREVKVTLKAGYRILLLPGERK